MDLRFISYDKRFLHFLAATENSNQQHNCFLWSEKQTQTPHHKTLTIVISHFKNRLLTTIDRHFY